MVLVILTEFRWVMSETIYMRYMFLLALLFDFLDGFENKPVHKLKQRDRTEAQEEPK